MSRHAVVARLARTLGPIQTPHNTLRVPLMTYVLATTENVLRWYRFEFNERTNPDSFALQLELDLAVIPQFKDKETAAKAAIALGLKTWRYVKLP